VYKTYDKDMANIQHIISKMSNQSTIKTCFFIFSSYKSKKSCKKSITESPDTCYHFLRNMCTISLKSLFNEYKNG